MATNLCNIGKHPLLDTLAFRNGLKYRNIDERLYNDDDPSISCKSLVDFGPVTPGITR